MKSRVTVRLTAVKCEVSKNTPGGVRFFVAGAAVADARQVNGIVTTPLSLEDGEARTFTAVESIVFDGILDEDEHVAVMLVARDERVAKDWRLRPDWIETIEHSVLHTSARGAVTPVERIVGDEHAGWATLAGGIGVGLTLGMYFLRTAREDDRALGYLNIVIGARGPTSESRDWLCPDESRARYAIRYEIARTAIHGETMMKPETKRRRMRVTAHPPAVVPGQTTRMTVSAVDAGTGEPVAGAARFLDLNDAFPTNVPFEAAFPTCARSGLRGAIARLLVRRHDRPPSPAASRSGAEPSLEELFDDDFDWSALADLTPKGLVSADQYESGVVVFDVVVNADRDDG